MKKTTALEILRRYSNYSIATFECQDICEVLVDANGQPFYDRVNLVYLWALDKDAPPFDSPESSESLIRAHFTLKSFADYLEEEKAGMDFSPWSARGHLGGGFTGMVRLLPFDLDWVIYLLSGAVIKRHIPWTQDDDADDQKALGKGGLYVDMGDWSPTRIAFDPDILRLDWDCAASASCRVKGVEGGFEITWTLPKEGDDQVDMAAEMGALLSDPTAPESSAQIRLSPKDAEQNNGGMDNGHLHSDQATATKEETI